MVLAIVFLPLLAQPAPAPPVALGRASPALTRLFTPQTVPPGTYQVFVSEAPIEDLVKALAAADRSRSRGEWDVQRPEGAGAFGILGTANRSRLARLFRGARVDLARGSIQEGSRAVAYTLISPYPDASLSAVRKGTLIVRLLVPEVPARR